MLSVKSACALTLAVVLAACSQSPAPDAASGKVVTEELPKPSVDQSTPDRALKSYFAIKDYLDARQYELDRDERGEALQRWADFKPLVTRDIWRDLSSPGSPPNRFSRDLKEVKVESESRAVIIVTIRNTTPIPAGAVPDKYDEKRRSEGELYRYIMEKQGADWQVAEVWNWEDYKNDWVKRFPSDGLPHVPSLTYEGA